MNGATLRVWSKHIGWLVQALLFLEHTWVMWPGFGTVIFVEVEKTTGSFFTFDNFYYEWGGLWILPKFSFSPTGSWKNPSSSKGGVSFFQYGWNFHFPKFMYVFSQFWGAYFWRFLTKGAGESKLLVGSMSYSRGWSWTQFRVGLHTISKGFPLLTGSNG